MLELADVICDMLSRPLFAAERSSASATWCSRNCRCASPIRRLDLGPSRDRRLRREPADVVVRGGVSAVIEKATREQLTEYHQAFYAPKSMCLVISGGATLSHDQALELLADIPQGKPRPRKKARWGLGDRYTANVRR